MKEQKCILGLAENHSSTLLPPELKRVTFAISSQRKWHLGDALKHAPSPGHGRDGLTGFAGLEQKIKVGKARLPSKGRGDLEHAPS